MSLARTPAVRSSERIRDHYQIERALAARLMAASRDERRTLYPQLYDEMLRRVPDHPLLVRKHSAEDSRRAVQQTMLVLGRFLRPGSTYLEVGAGDCALAFEAARTAAKVFAVDVSETLTGRSDRPPNAQVVISDGTSIPVEAGSVDLAFSNQLMEHLHPDDAREQLANIHRALRIGGRYLCATPNRLSGPHDVSLGFDPVATGFHLKEYTTGELAKLFREVGFTKVKAWGVFRGRPFRLPVWFVSALEHSLSLLPRRWRHALGNGRPLVWLLGVLVTGDKR